MVALMGMAWATGTTEFLKRPVRTAAPVKADTVSTAASAAIRTRFIGSQLSGQRPLQPDAAHIHGGVETVLLGLLHHAIAGAQVGVGELQLHGHAGSHVHILFLLGVQDLEHHDILALPCYIPQIFCTIVSGNVRIAAVNFRF